MMLRHRVSECWRKVKNFTYNVYKWRTILSNDYDWDHFYTYNALYFKICSQIKWFEKSVDYYQLNDKTSENYNPYCRDLQSIRYMKIVKRLLEITYLEMSNIDSDNLPKFNIRKGDIPKWILQNLEENPDYINSNYCQEYIYLYRCKKLLHKILLEDSSAWWD